MIYVILFVFITAVGNVFLHFMGLKMPSMLLVFLSTSYAIVYFNTINLTKLNLIYKKTLQFKLLYLRLSIFLLFMWLGSFFVPIYFLPSIHLISYMSITAACGVFALYYTTSRHNHLLKFVMLLINMLAFYIVCAYHYHGSQLVLLVSVTLITGLSGYWYIKTSAMFNKLEFTATQILAIRFWSLWLVSLVYVIVDNEFSVMTFSLLGKTLIVALLTLIIPIYCSQKSIEKIGPNQTSIWIGFTPLVTFGFERVFIGNSFDYTGVFAVILGLILLAFAVLGLKPQKI